MNLTFLGFLARAGILISAIITLGLNAKFLTITGWNNELLGYIIAIAVFSLVACLVPPYPNFLYDLFWALAASISALFALVIQFVDSGCYGVRPDNGVNCAVYKAGTAFTFLVALGWIASTFLVRLDIQGAADEKDAQKADRKDGGKPVKKKKKIKFRIIYAAPAFANYLIDNIAIPEVEVTLLNPTNDSIQFSVLSNIRVPDAMSVTFNSMRAQFFRPETRDDPIPFATIHLPKLKFPANEKITLVNQSLTLGDVDQFAALVEDVAYNSVFSVAAQANAKIGVGTLTTKVDLVEVVSFSGFNNFTDIQINKIGIMPPDEQDNNIYAEVVIFNPAPITVTLVRPPLALSSSNHVTDLTTSQGEVTLSILLANLPVGQATIPIANVTPGNNTFTINANLNTPVIQENIQEIIESQIPYLRDGNTTLTATGLSVVYNGQHLEYWEKALQAIRISITRPVREIVAMVMDSSGGEGLDSVVVGNLVDRILEMAGGLGEDENEDGYTEGLGRLVLRLLTLLGVL
ncbi:hypothetical protein BDW59DRAFT_169571 [Aspergillus cavernicola]|uniref:MARVEL domain-containing protein n=1 Tax=Aspergillus cavernicola TaxID=176166 RepID=A0ABR4IVC1_9EURO